MERRAFLAEPSAQIGQFVAVGATLGASFVSASLWSTVGAVSVPTCSSISIASLDKALAIDAVKVNADRPASPAGSLICSYYGLSGQAQNEATINYVPATPFMFAAVEKALANKYAISLVGGLKSRAYEYYRSGNHYLYVLDGGYQVQLFGIQPLGRIERLARKLPNF
jgi:hypothetical protein